MQTITRDALQEKKDDPSVTVVNVLSAEQFEQEHIPGSISIPLDQLEETAPERFDKDDEIVVYCASKSCQASPKAAKQLDAMGFQHVYDYEGGLADWKEAGLSTDSGA